jgi:hypothetical protein
MALGIRGSNPIWLEADLQGNLFDDTFYLWVLENTLPYVPATVYHKPDLSDEWTNPIQFLGNGTLPVDIFFEEDKVYRLEFRQNDGSVAPSQSDPLIYEVNDYVPGTGGAAPDEPGSFASGNQAANPQFALINFTSPYTLTSVTDPDPIEIGPGWFLELTGTGSVTITQVPLDDGNINPSNSPYALELELSGWDLDGVILRQRFQQNGMLWARKTVSTTITARLEGAPQSIIANLYDSNNSLLTNVLPLTPVNEAWNEFTGHGTLPETTNPDDPPSAYIDYRLILPSNVDIYVTGIQLIVQDENDLSEPSFEQNSIEWQIDHTFHYYKPKLEFKPIPSLLTAWDFPLNPAQINGSTVTVNATAAYVWDQTIMIRSAANVSVARNPITGGLRATTGGANDSFYMLQYLEGSEAKKMLGTRLSVNINAFKGTVGTSATARVYLFRGSSAASFPTLPTSLGTINAAGVFTLTAANWTAIPRSGTTDNIGTTTLTTVTNNVDMNADCDYGFSGWEITDNTEIGDTDKFAIVVTFAAPTNATVITVNSISVVPGDIPTRPAPQTLEEVLCECQYYWEKSYATDTAVATATGQNSIFTYQPDEFDSGGLTHTWYRAPFLLDYKTTKRIAPGASSITLYDIAGNANSVRYTVYDGTTPATTGGGKTFTPSPAQLNLASTQWTQGFRSTKRATFLNNVTTAVVTESTLGAFLPELVAAVEYHYVVNCLLGVV